MQLTYYSQSDPGLVRPNNQDSSAVLPLDPRGNAALLVVADGMGGYEGGEVASRLAVDTVVARVQDMAATWAERGGLGEGLAQTIDAANRAILQAQQEQPGFASMGSTLTAALIWGERIFIGHIGDSKACLINRDGAQLVTTEHSVAGELLQSGHLTEEQAKVHPQRHVLTRALGIGEGMTIERRELTWQEGDTLVLFSDGLSNHVSLTEIQELAAEGFDQLHTRLVDLAKSRGGHDNITVLTARWEVGQ